MKPAAAYGGHDTCHARADRFLVVTVITIGHDCDPLETLLMSLLAAPGALFGIQDSDVEWHPPVAN
jgi:hypothetical protein